MFQNSSFQTWVQKLDSFEIWSLGKDFQGNVYAGGFYRPTDASLTLSANLNPTSKVWDIIQTSNGDLFTVSNTSPYAVVKHKVTGSERLELVEWLSRKLVIENYLVKSFRDSNFFLRTSDFGLPTSDFRLQTSVFGFPTSDFRLRTSTILSTKKMVVPYKL